MTKYQDTPEAKRLEAAIKRLRRAVLYMDVANGKHPHHYHIVRVLSKLGLIDYPIF